MEIQKFFSDRYYANSFVSRELGIPLPELNQMEMDFLDILDFDISVSEKEYSKYLQSLQVFAQSNEATVSKIAKEIEGNQSQ